MRATVRIAVILALVALLVPTILSACPLCKEAEADTPGGSASLGRGFYYSILLMIAVPWTAVGTVAFLIFRKRRRSGEVAGNSSALPDARVAHLLPDSRGARS
jgi:heme/copper-type cytochrome/quinol oxidase subunit 2